MTVLGQSSIIRRIWRGWDNPSLPVATWIGRATVTGDLSGGDAIMQIELWPEAQAGAGHFFNVEQIMVQTDGDNDGVYSLIAINFSHPIDGALSNLEWSIQMKGNELGNNAMLLGEAMLPRPLFLGQPQLPDGRAALSLTADNTDAEVYQFQAEGYVWEPRSVQAPGGLQRPPGALYG